MSFSAKERLRIQMYEGDDKDLILEAGNGMGGGHHVRDGVAFLTAYAKALGMSRRAFVHLLRYAPGTVEASWRESMTPAELREIGEEVEEENEGSMPSTSWTSDVMKAGEAAAADDEAKKQLIAADEAYRAFLAAEGVSAPREDHLMMGRPQREADWPGWPLWEAQRDAKEEAYWRFEAQSAAQLAYHYDRGLRGDALSDAMAEYSSYDKWRANKAWGSW